MPVNLRVGKAISEWKKNCEAFKNSKGHLEYCIDSENTFRYEETFKKYTSPKYDDWFISEFDLKSNLDTSYMTLEEYNNAKNSI